MASNSLTDQWNNITAWSKMYLLGLKTSQTNVRYTSTCDKINQLVVQIEGVRVRMEVIFQEYTRYKMDI